jgi:NADH:ubiquinone oxidoreductase subunit B-like Fe-S oxidoreductase
MLTRERKTDHLKLLQSYRFILKSHSDVSSMTSGSSFSIEIFGVGCASSEFVLGMTVTPFVNPRYSEVCRKSERKTKLTYCPLPLRRKRPSFATNHIWESQKPE